MSSTVAAKSVNSLADRYCVVRQQSQSLAEPLTPEDACVQSMEDASPAKWHLAHTTWFFETFLLRDYVPHYEPYDADFHFLFNSYYNAVGEQYSRPHRGLLTRPELSTVFAYRHYVDEHMARLLDSNIDASIGQIIEVGLHHEQQHQELLLMDIKHLFSCNPTAPAYTNKPHARKLATADRSFHRFDGRIVSVGANGDEFSFDNERPRHQVLQHDFCIASLPVTNREYLEFICDDGYRNPLLWLADGWATVTSDSWQAPLYWRSVDSEWFEFTLRGLRALDLDAPVTHVSYYEADAYARWAQARLPTEAEWERAAGDQAIIGNFVESGALHPLPTSSSTDMTAGPQQLFGDVWEWTMSPYTAYPGFKTPAGAIGEYNGKFMSGQMVLRGGCCATPADHIRASYRNFFYPKQRWQFSGIRLAKD